MPERASKVPEEAEEFKSHNNEDLLETEGSNKGNIKDEELARIGAEAEDRVRSGTMHNLKKMGDVILGGNSAERDAQWVGERAMEKEIHRRIEVKGKAKNLSPEAIKSEQRAATGHNYGKGRKGFTQRQSELTSERVSEERKEL